MATAQHEGRTFWSRSVGWLRYGVARRPHAAQQVEEEHPDHHFFADRPIETRAEDLLGRRNFAETLADLLRRWRGRDSLVVALYGAWGSGKSSVKNMVRDALAGGDAPTIVEFNPWQLSTRDEITSAFFREVGIALDRDRRPKRDRRRVARLWRAYAAYLNVGASFARLVRSRAVLVLVAVVFTALGVSLAHLPPEVIGILAALVIATALLKPLRDVVAAIAAVAEARERLESKSLSEVKDELAAALRKLNSPLIVVMDDVDRLTGAETREVMQLVKANADFPNLVYLLLLHRESVERSLEEVSPISGRDFLEKIVQVPFDVPEVEQERVDDILVAGLSRILQSKGARERFDLQRCQNLYLGCLQPYFRSLRSVYRFLSTFAFHTTLFTSGESFEVNPIDLIALEVLRVFEPDVYRAIAQRKGPLTSTSEGGRGEEEPRRKAIETIFDVAEKRSVVQEIVSALFPRVERLFGGSGYSADFDDTWFREGRVCSAQLFDRYFKLAIPSGDISQATLDRLRRATGNRDELRSELRALAAAGQLGTAMNRLEAYKEDVPLDDAVPFVTALMDIGDELPSDKGGVFSIGADMHASRIIYWFLRREPDEGRRLEVLREAIKTTDGLYLPVFKVSLEEGTRKEGERERSAKLVGDAGLAELQRLCLEKIRAAANDGRLERHPRLAYILFRWREWGDAEEPREFCRRLAPTREGAVSLVAAFLQESRSWGMQDRVARRNLYFRPSLLAEFVEPETVEGTLETVPLESLADDQRQAVVVFRAAMERRRQGKPEADGGRVRDDGDES
jgi:predicted KAP-like P-loop ATPase